MNELSTYTLKILHKLYNKAFFVPPPKRPDCIDDADNASCLIYDKLISEQPCMVARFGAFELATVTNYIDVKKRDHSIRKYLKGEESPWWWNKRLIQFMQSNAGFFPTTIENIEKFCELMLKDIPYTDILGSWLPNEIYFEKELQNCHKIDLEILNPYFSTIPWTKALENKKVLVIHPFAQSIENQYRNRELLFENKDVLPTFELQTIQAVQSIGGGDNVPYANWFEALDAMKGQTDKLDFDICLIGCGAYGFPLAAHVKRSGKQAVHMGGSLQLLFGIKGKRWEDTNYNKRYNYAKLMNEYWIKPDKTEKPKKAEKVESACYWMF